MDALQISRSGLDVEWQRMEIIAQNIANMNTTRTGDGGAFIPLRLVSGPDESFEQMVGRIKSGSPTQIGPIGVRTFGIEEVDNGTRQSYEPGHPHADPDGLVTFPNVSTAQEMTLMLKTARAYEANLVAMSSAQQMYSSAIRLGRQS